MVNPSVILRTICAKNALHLSDGDLALLSGYVERLIEWNKKINLISRRNVENIWFSHILHCVAPLFYVNIPRGWKILDIGSGGGLPGIPLAIVRPDLSVTLLDSIKKKTMATEEIVRSLHLENVNVRTERAEDLAKDKGFLPVDMAVARAVAPLEDLARWSRPLIVARRQEETLRKKNPAPHLLALKGGDLDREIGQARRLGGIAITVIDMIFEGSLDLDLEDKKLVLVHFS